MLPHEASSVIPHVALPYRLERARPAFAHPPAGPPEALAARRLELLPPCGADVVFAAPLTLNSTW